MRQKCSLWYKVTKEIFFRIFFIFPNNPGSNIEGAEYIFAVSKLFLALIVFNHFFSQYCLHLSVSDSEQNYTTSKVTVFYLSNWKVSRKKPEDYSYFFQFSKDRKL